MNSIAYIVKLLQREEMNSMSGADYDFEALPAISENNITNESR